MLNKHFRLISVLLILSIVVALLIGAKSCINRNSNKTKAGSSVDTFMINAPSNLTVTAFSTVQIDLSWQDNSNNEDRFEIERSVSTNTNYTLLATLSANTTSYFDSSVNSFTNYSYRIRAFNTIGDRSYYSNIVSAFAMPQLWLAVYAGEEHTIAISNDRTIWSWGNNDYGQLGLGDSLRRLFPNQIGFETDWQTVKAGGYHTLAIKTNGELWSWGLNFFGQLGMGDTVNNWVPFNIDSNTDWSEIVCGYNHSIAKKNNSTFWVWGDNQYVQLGIGETAGITAPVLFGTDTDWSQLTASLHTIAIKTNGTIWSWGRNNYGQLGLGDINNRNTPVKIGNDSDWSNVTTGWVHTVAIKTNGTMWSCGWNRFGALGIGDIGIDLKNVFTLIGTDSDWSTVSGGSEFSVAIKTNGSLWGWGVNTGGQLGLIDLQDRYTPSQIGTNTNWQMIAAGLYHVIGLTRSGNIFCWGGNSSGQLGLGDTIYRCLPFAFGSPFAPSSLTVTVISSSSINLSWIDNSGGKSGFKVERRVNCNGSWEEVAVVNANTVFWTDTTITGFATYYYRIKAYNGFGDSSYSNIAYSAISGNWGQIRAGWYHTVSLKSAGTLWLWGRNDSGQLGDGTDVDRYSPVQIDGNTDWSSIACGDAHSIAIKDNGTIWSWGFNNYGQLGLGDQGAETERYMPTPIASDSDWSSVAAGYRYTIALKTNRTLWSWGWNVYGQLGLGFIGASRNTPVLVGTDSDWNSIASGNRHSLSVKTNNTLWVWGYNDRGQLGLGDTTISRITPSVVGSNSDWSVINSSGYYSAAVKTNGILWSWGYNEYGQLGLGDTDNRNIPIQIGTASDWSKIAGGDNHMIAIKSDGFIWAWGSNDFGQLGLSDTNSRYTPCQIGSSTNWITVTAGYDHSLGLMNNGTIWSWGRNDRGQLGLGDMIYRNVPTMIGE